MRVWPREHRILQHTIQAAESPADIPQHVWARYEVLDVRMEKKKECVRACMAKGNCSQQAKNVSATACAAWKTKKWHENGDFREKQQQRSAKRNTTRAEQAKALGVKLLCNKTLGTKSDELYPVWFYNKLRTAAQQLCLRWVETEIRAQEIYFVFEMLLQRE